ncbi:MAG: hypothetical protein ACTSQA_02135 [Candidatus Heimdallarchaeaceae archaeon]
MNEIKEIKDFYKIKDRLLDLAFMPLTTATDREGELKSVYKLLENYREKYILKKKSYEKQDT